MNALTSNKALVIDDDVLVQQAMKMVLESEGYVIHIADNGRQALQEISDFEPDIVITDIVMPDMEGLELIRSIRKMNLSLPILAISGMGPQQGGVYLQQAEKLGANMVLAKPFKRDQLLGSIRQLLPS